MKKKMIAAYIVLGLLLIGLCIGGFALFGFYQVNKVPLLSAGESLNYTLQGKADGVITIGILENGAASYRVYGENGKELPQTLHTYEIGSLTKTFTAALVCQAVQEGRIQLDATIDTYLNLSQQAHYPTIRQLLTHTSGYKGYYLESPMVSNFFHRRNDFYGISGEMLLDRLGKVSPSGEAHPFLYSNFGYAVLGQILETVYGAPYTDLVNHFALDELSLPDTHISAGGDLGNLWDWAPGDAYMAAGALTSNAEDMLAYAALLLDGSVCGGTNLDPLSPVGVSNAQYEKMGIRMDSVAYGWLHDEQHGFIWHNGGTGHYNCYLGLDPDNDRAVVVLSNLSPADRIPATVIGVKILEEMRRSEGNDPVLH